MFDIVLVWDRKEVCYFGETYEIPKQAKYLATDYSGVVRWYVEMPLIAMDRTDWVTDPCSDKVDTVKFYGVNLLWRCKIFT